MLSGMPPGLLDIPVVDIAVFAFTAGYPVCTIGGDVIIPIDAGAEINKGVEEGDLIIRELHQEFKNEDVVEITEVQETIF